MVGPDFNIVFLGDGMGVVGGGEFIVNSAVKSRIIHITCILLNVFVSEFR